MGTATLDGMSTTPLACWNRVPVREPSTPVALVLIATLLALGACTTTPSASSTDIVVTAAEQGQTVRIAPGQRMVVELLGNPSTGRVWELRALPDAAVLIPDGTRWVAAGGAGADTDLARTQQLRFIAQGTGRVLLVFEYVQPDAPSDDASSFSVAVEVMSP